MAKIQFFDFDINKTASERWMPILDFYADHLSSIKNKLKEILKNSGLPLFLMKPVYDTIPKNKILYHDEICYIATRMNMHAYEILLLQLIYETSSACTSTVLKIGTENFYFRTMDWNMSFLKDITIGLNIISDNKKIGRAITWVGYVGFLTATNIVEKYSIAINYRKSKNFNILGLIKNVHRTIGMCWPIGILVRHIIENKFNLYDTKKKLEEAELISPCYITLYVPDYQTYILTRDCDKLIDIRTEDLIQTNCDNNMQGSNILYSYERIEQIKKIQKKIDKYLEKNYQISVETILKWLSEHPVINETTIYYYYEYKTDFNAFVI